MAADLGSETEEKRKNWLRNLLYKNVDESMTPETQVAVIRALILECQKRGVEQVLKRSRKPLRRWKHIAWGIALLRLCCVIVILSRVIRMRYHYDFIIGAVTNSLVLKMVYHGTMQYLFFVITFVFVEILLIICFEIQRSTPIAFCYALNFVMAIFIIGVIPFLVAFNAYALRITSDMYAYAFPYPMKRVSNDVKQLHYHFQCCGFTNRNDWKSAAVFNITTLFTNEKVEKPNSFQWTDECSSSTGYACYVPEFCCSRLRCHVSDVPGATFAAIIRTLADESSEKAATYFHQHFDTIPDGAYEKPCLVVISENLGGLARSLCLWLGLFTILTFVMTLLIIVILLYNSGQGELLPHINRVRSPHCSPLVWAFIKLDKDKKDDHELSDYSLIEDLKNFNIDLDVTDVE